MEITSRHRVVMAASLVQRLGCQRLPDLSVHLDHGITAVTRFIVVRRRELLKGFDYNTKSSSDLISRFIFITSIECQ